MFIDGSDYNNPTKLFNITNMTDNQLAMEVANQLRQNHFLNEDIDEDVLEDLAEDIIYEMRLEEGDDE